MGINEIQIILIELADVALKEGLDQDAHHLAELSRDTIRLFDLWDYYSFVAPLQVAIAQKNVQIVLNFLNPYLLLRLNPGKWKNRLCTAIWRLKQARKTSVHKCYRRCLLNLRMVHNMHFSNQMQTFSN